MCASYRKSAINAENAKNFELIKRFSGYFPITGIAIEAHYIMINSLFVSLIRPNYPRG
jgi:hypothetical protein